MGTKVQVNGFDPSRDIPELRALYRAEGQARLARYRLFATWAVTDAGVLPEVLYGPDTPLPDAEIAPRSCLSETTFPRIPDRTVDHVLEYLAAPELITMSAGWVGAGRSLVERDVVHAVMALFGLPWLVDAIEVGERFYHHLDAVLRQADGLDAAQLRALDAEISTWRPVTMATFQRRLGRAIAEITNPDPAVAAATVAAERRVTIAPERGGSASLIMRGPACDVLAFYQRLSAEARAIRRNHDGEITDPRTLAQLRFDLMGEAVVGGTHPAFLPAQAKVSVTVPVLTALGHADEPGEILGFGPLDAESARDLARSVPVWERILTDPGTGQILPATATYRIPDALRRHVELRNRFCTAPGCSRRAVLCEVDHLIPFDHASPDAGGPTAAGNLHPLCTFHHQLKTQGKLTVARQQAPDGRLLGMMWRLPGSSRPVFVPDDIDDANLKQVEWLVAHAERLQRERERVRDADPPPTNEPPDESSPQPPPPPASWDDRDPPDSPPQPDDPPF